MSRPSRPSSVSATIRYASLALALVALGGCNELSARRAVQEGNAEYGEQNYDKAAAHFEKAIAKAPDLEIAHHNLGITYSRMFKPGVDTPENKALADKAAVQLTWWLAKHPDDTKIRKLITGIWIDADEYEAALAFWKKEHDRDPASRDVLQTVAGIYLKSGDWRSAIDWYRKDVEAAKDIPGKVAALSAIANVSFGKLFGGREKVFGVERCEIAEIGLEAAEQGIKLDPKAIALWGTSQGLWANRSVANGQSWAYQIDQAEAQVFAQQARVLREEAKKAQAAAGGDPAAPAGTPPAGAAPGAAPAGSPPAGSPPGSGT
jgi:tetratricopeptide (TPR) repeat protein